jgi:hypothetical protein
MGPRLSPPIEDRMLFAGVFHVTISILLSRWLSSVKWCAALLLVRSKGELGR